MELKTPLYDAHVKAGGKMVPFAGYILPVQYGTGVNKEHLAVRTAVGMFDVSHMGEILCEGPDALANLNRILTNDFTSMVLEQARKHMATRRCCVATQKSPCRVMLRSDSASMAAVRKHRWADSKSLEDFRPNLITMVVATVLSTFEEMPSLVLILITTSRIKAMFLVPARESQLLFH